MLDGPFTVDQFTVNVPTPQCLTRDFTPTIMNSFAQQSLVDVVLATPDYTAFARAIENVPSFDQPNIHGSGHFGVGGALGTIGDAYNSPGGKSINSDIEEARPPAVMLRSHQRTQCMRYGITNGALV